MPNTKVLIVEDEHIVALDMKNRLQQFGYEVVEHVGSGQEAIRSVKTLKPDVVLMDIQLKGDFDGIQTAEYIKQHQDIPIIFITAYADKTTLERAKGIEAFGYLIKPYNDRELYTNIEVALYKHTMEKKLRQSERWLDTTLNSIADGVIATNSGECIRFMNPAAENLTGFSINDAKSSSIERVFMLSEDSEFDSAITEVPELKGKYFLLRRKDGSFLPIEITKSSIKDINGDVLGSVYVFKDISLRRDFELKLREAKEKAEAANRVKNTFLANMTHELRTPLNSIIGMAELCLEHTKKSDVIDNLHLIHSSGSSLLSLINSILDYTNIEAGNFQTQAVNFHLDSFLPSILDQFREKTDSKPITLTATVKKGCPIAIKGDKYHLSTILTHLIENAVKFTKEGNIDVTVAMESNAEFFGEDTLFLIFSVSDTGIGISPQQRDSIFNPFMQGDSSYTREYGGTGLGLTIVKSMVQFMSGDIKVESIEGSGSTFTVRLPFYYSSENARTRFAIDDTKVSLNGGKRKAVQNNIYTAKDIESLIELLPYFRKLAEEKEYKRIEAEASKQRMRLKDANAKTGNLFFKLMLAARRSDHDKLEHILKEIDLLYRR